MEGVRGVALGASSPAEAKREALSLCEQATGGEECLVDPNVTTVRCISFAEGELSYSSPLRPEPLITTGNETSNDQAAASDAAVTRCQEIEKTNIAATKTAGYETQITGACRVVLAKCAGE